MREGWKVGLVAPLALLVYGCGGGGVEQATLEGYVRVPQEQAAWRAPKRVSPLDLFIPKAYADIRGVPLPSAQVKAVDPTTGQVLATTETDSEGYYRIPGLPTDRVVQVVAEKSAAPGALRLAAFAMTQRGRNQCDLDEHTTVAAKALELALERVEAAGGQVGEVLKHLDIYKRIEASAEQAGLIPILTDDASVTQKASEALKKALDQILAEAEADPTDENCEEAAMASLWAATMDGMALPVDEEVVSKAAQLFKECYQKKCQFGITTVIPLLEQTFQQAGLNIDIPADDIQQVLTEIREDLPQSAGQGTSLKVSEVILALLKFTHHWEQTQGHAEGLVFKKHERLVGLINSLLQIAQQAVG